MRHGTPMYPTRSAGSGGPAHGAARSAAHRAPTTPGLHRPPEPAPSTADTTYLPPSSWPAWPPPVTDDDVPAPAAWTRPPTDDIPAPTDWTGPATDDIPAPAAWTRPATDDIPAPAAWTHTPGAGTGLHRPSRTAGAPGRRAQVEPGRRSRAASAPRPRTRDASTTRWPTWLDAAAGRRTGDATTVMRPAWLAGATGRPARGAASHGRRTRINGPQHGRTTPTPTLRRARPQPPCLALPGPRTAQVLTKGLAMLIVLGVTGLIGFFIFADARRGRSAEASTTDQGALAAGVLGSRASDPAPLTLPEVFPDPTEVRPSPAGPAYRLTMTHIDTECAIATVGTLGKLLQDHGCTQVVRAAMAAPYGDYLVTAGLFNLADAAGATALDDQLRLLVETGDGGFAAMATGEPGADPTTPPPSQVGWRSRGHYLLYCVITRPDDRLTAAGDPNAARITADLVDDYLTVSVLGRRTGSGT